VEEAEQGRRPVEGAIAAAEGGVAKGAEPGLADEGRAEEVRGLFGREAEEDLAHELGHQFRRRRSHGAALDRNPNIYKNSPILVRDR
jgi:hypothetical protein